MRYIVKCSRRYRSDTSGNVSIMFGAAVTMLLIGISVAVDFTGMVSKKTKLQDVVDSAVLAAVASGYETEKELQAFVSDFVAGANDQGLRLEATVTSKNTLIISVTDDYEMFIAGAFGHDDKPIVATAEAPLAGKTRANLALVLDTTDSMSGNRMATLRSASALLLEELAKSSEGGEENVQVSLVPFANYVRISNSNEGENWLQLQPAQEVTWQVLDEENSVNCRQVGQGDTASLDCDEYAYSENTEFLKWEGCMGSRTNGFHTKPAFEARRLQGFVAHADCSTENNLLEPLTSDLNSISDVPLAL